MKLPDLERAHVPQGKVTDYLLSSTHREGSTKAAFFRAMGFAIERWLDLALALLAHAAQHEVASVESSPFGTRYRVDGLLETPAGRSPTVRTVWFVDDAEAGPRLVTAYPIGPRPPRLAR